MIFIFDVLSSQTYPKDAYFSIILDVLITLDGQFTSK
jgi:hypothetical protein